MLVGTSVRPLAAEEHRQKLLGDLFYELRPPGWKSLLASWQLQLIVWELDAWFFRCVRS